MDETVKIVGAPDSMTIQDERVTLNDDVSVRALYNHVRVNQDKYTCETRKVFCKGQGNCMLMLQSHAQHVPIIVSGTYEAVDELRTLLSKLRCTQKLESIPEGHESFASSRRRRRPGTMKGNTRSEGSPKGGARTKRTPARPTNAWVEQCLQYMRSHKTTYAVALKECSRARKRSKESTGATRVKRVER